MEASLQITKEKQMEIRDLAREHEYITATKPPYVAWKQDANPEEMQKWIDNYQAHERWERLLKGQMIWEMGERVRGCLHRNDIVTDYDLLRCTPKQLLRIYNFGKTSLASVNRVLALHGYQLKEENNGN